MFITRFNRLIILITILSIPLLLHSCASKKKLFQAQAKLYEFNINQVRELGYTIPQKDLELNQIFSEAVEYKNYAVTNSYEDQVIQRNTILSNLIKYNETYSKYVDIFNALQARGYEQYDFNSQTAYFIYPLKFSLLTNPLLKNKEQELKDALTNFESQPDQNLFFLDRKSAYYINALINYEKYNYKKLTQAFFESCIYMPYDFNFRPYLEEVYKLENIFDVSLSNDSNFHGYCSFDHLYYEITTQQRIYTIIDTPENDFLYRINDTIDYASNLIKKLEPMNSPINGAYIYVENKLSNVQHGERKNKSIAKIQSLSEKLSTKKIESVKLYYIKDKNNEFSFPKQVFVNNQKIDTKRLINLTKNERYNVKWGETLDRK